MVRLSLVSSTELVVTSAKDRCSTSWEKSADSFSLEKGMDRPQLT